MIRMLACFDLAAGCTEEAFRVAAEAFVAEMRALGLVEGAPPLATRLRHPCMDTDRGRDQDHLLVMEFRDLAQMEAAYAHIEAGIEPARTLHRRMYAMVRNAVFTCWEGPEGSVGADRGARG